MDLHPAAKCKVEVRAIKDISKGDEITRSYLSSLDILMVGADAQERKNKIQDRCKFECKCCVIVPGQEYKLELENKYYLGIISLPDWAKRS